MNISSLSHIYAPINSANLSPKRPPRGLATLPPRSCALSDWVEPMIRARYLGVRLEWRSDERARVAGNDDRFPRAWLARADLTRMLDAVPLPSTLHDPVFLELWVWADDYHDLGLEATRAGRFRLRDDDGRVVRRARKLEGIADYLDARALARDGVRGEDWAPLWQNVMRWAASPSTSFDGLGVHA